MFRRIKKIFDNSLTVLFVYLLTSLGCSPITEIESVVHLVPETLDFGAIREGDSPVTGEFTIVNDTDSPLEILDVISGCGCTVLETPSHPIAPHDSYIVPIKIDFSGKSGYFSNSVFIRTSLTKEPLLMNLKGRIVEDIWLSNRTLRCVIENENSALATGTFEIRTIDYSDIVFDTNTCGEGFSIQELSREDIGGETVIKFRVNVDYSPNKHGKHEICQLELVPANYDIKHLTLQIICFYKNEGIAMAPIHTMQVNISQIKPGEQCRVLIKGEPNILSTIFDVSLVNATKELSAVICETETQIGVLFLSLSLDGDASPGLINGQISLKTTSGNSYYIPLFGRIVDN